MSSSAPINGRYVAPSCRVWVPKVMTDPLVEHTSFFNTPTMDKKRVSGNSVPIETEHGWLTSIMDTIINTYIARRLLARPG
jgi:hypothetical protein